MNKWQPLLYLQIHPVNGFEDLKYKKNGSVAIANLILLAWFVLTILKRQLTNFRFNYNNADQLNVLYILVGTVLMFAFWCIANWSFCTLLDGEGKFKEIWIFCAYSLVPYIFFMAVSILLSYVMTVDAEIFLQWVDYIGVLWSAVLIFTGLSLLHQYSFSKSIGAVFLTILGMAFISFIGILVITLFQQVILFFVSIYQEILSRI